MLGFEGEVEKESKAEPVSGFEPTRDVRYESKREKRLLGDLAWAEAEAEDVCLAVVRGMSMATEDAFRTGELSDLISCFTGLPLRDGELLRDTNDLIEPTGDARGDDSLKAAGWTGASGSIKQVFLSMAGRTFLSRLLVLPAFSRTGNVRHGSMSATSKLRMNIWPRSPSSASSSLPF